MAVEILVNYTLASYLAASIIYAVYCTVKRKFPLYLGTILLLTGWLLNTVYIVMRWIIGNRPPFSNMYESLLFFAWCLAITYLVFQFSTRVFLVGAAASFLATATVGYASLLDPTIRPLVPALQSNWLTIHVITCFLAYGAFALSFVTAITYQVTIPRRRKKIYSKHAKKSTDKKTDNESRLEDFCYRSIAFGFPFLTIGIITGAVWANSAWGTYWSWDPKETWSLITWIVYGIYLHTRFLPGWRGKRSIWLALAGFIVVLFTYFGVNYILSGLHSYR